MIRVHVWRSWIHAGTRYTKDVPYRANIIVRDVVPDEFRDRSQLTVHVNGVVSTLGAKLSPFDHVDVSVRPTDPISIVATALISAAVSTAVSYVISLILPKPKGPKKRGDQESATYAWSGKDNTRVEGQPRNVVYGEMQIAPQIIDQFVRTTTVPPQSDLYVLMYLGEGQIEAVGNRNTDSPLNTWLSQGDASNPLPRGIEIEGNPASNYSGVQAQVRLGTSEQDPLIEFGQIHTLSDVSQTLTQAETSATSNIATAWNLTSFPYNSNDSTVQAVWTQHAKSFSLPNAADSIVCTVNFPDGLYKLSGTSGALQDAYFSALIRYRELDSFGAAITTGGDNGDGWVYAPPVQAIASHHQGPFPYEFTAQLFSSTGFTPGAQGRILEASTAGAYAYTAATNGGTAANASVPWTAGNVVDEMTIEGWYKPTSLPLTGTGTTNTVRPIFEWMTFAAGVYRGFSLMLIRNDVDVGDGVLVPKWRLRFYWGDGTGTLKFKDDLASIAPESGLDNFTVSRWYHLAVTFKHNAVGTFERISLTIDGVSKKIFTGGISDIIAPSAPIYLARTAVPLGATQAGGGRLDEWRFWSTEKTLTQIAATFNGFVGVFGVNAADLVAGWHFDLPDVLTAYTFSNDYSSRNNDVTSTAGATMGDPVFVLDAVVFRPGSGTAKRAQYLVQLMRFNVKSTSTYIQDRSEWTSIDGVVEAELAYPNSGILALKIPATDQLNTNEPTITVVVKGKRVPVWDGVSTSSPNITYQWSANPAWVSLDMLTNRRYGRGGDFDFSTVDLVSLKEWADYCDALVYDAKGSTSIHSTNSAIAISNLQYDSTLNSGFGGLIVYFRAGFAPPVGWAVGGFVGFTGIASPPTSGISVDINAVAGFEITSIVLSGTYQVTLKYDKATLGDPWLDGSFLSTVINPTAVTGSVSGREARFRFDGNFDTFGKVWDQLMLVGATARAVPVLEGRTVRWRVSRPRSSVGIVSMGSILQDSFKIQYTGPRERPNLYEADFLDADRNWRRSNDKAPRSDDQAALPEGALNRENIDLFGVTRRSQLRRDLDFRLKVNKTLVRQVEWGTSLEALPYESGDVVILAHDLVPWGQSGRFDATCSGTTITLDRSITLAAATTYYIQVRSNAAGQTGSGSSTADWTETRQITSSAGTYAAGASITIASAFTFAPTKDDPYVVYSLAEQKLFEIGDITLGSDNSRNVKGLQYDATVYDVDTLPEDIPAELQFSMHAPDPGPDFIPAPVEGLTVLEQQSRDAAGSWIAELRASWKLDTTTARHVSEVVVLGKMEGATKFEEIARMRGPATSVTLRPSGLAPGVTMQIAVQPVTTSGKRAHATLCSSTPVTVVGIHIPPPPPTNFQAVLDGDQVTYSWTPPAEARGLSYEVRRGGWIVGQLVGIAGIGSTQLGPTRNWSAAKDNVRGDGPPILVLRSRDARGHLSEPVILTGFNPAVSGSTVLTPPNVVGRRINGDQRWEDYGSGWSGGSPATTLTGLEVYTLVDGRKALRFTGSNLTGTYETAVGTIDADSRPEHAYVEAFAQASQLAPITLAQMTIPLGDPLASRRTWEGAIVSRDGAEVGCTLTIEWRYKLQPSDSYTDWQEFTPGLFYFVAPQFRLRLTRPDTTWDVWVYSFGTRLSRAAAPKNIKKPIQQFIEASAVSLG